MTIWKMIAVGQRYYTPEVYSGAHLPLSSRNVPPGTAVTVHYVPDNAGVPEADHDGYITVHIDKMHIGMVRIKGELFGVWFKSDPMMFNRYLSPSAPAKKVFPDDFPLP